MHLAALAAAAIAAIRRPVVRIIVVPLTAFTLVLSLILALAGVPVAFAEDAVVITESSPWTDFWAALQAPLLAFATAVLGALGIAITGVVRRKFGAEAALAFNRTYEIAMTAAAGWLKARLQGRALDDKMLDEAVEYVLSSYPEVRDIEPRAKVIADDILAALGRLGVKA